LQNAVSIQITLPEHFASFVFKKCVSPMLVYTP